MAAKPFNLHAQIPAIRWLEYILVILIIIIVFRYEFASPEVLAGTTETLRKDTLCMFTPDEVVAHITSVT